MGNYPNLDLVEERFKNLIRPELEAKAEEIKKDGGFSVFEFDVQMFRQLWPNTAGLFANLYTMSGQAFAYMYTTVIHESVTDIYGIFGGNRCAYVIKGGNDAFFEDLGHLELCAASDAAERYGATIVKR